MTLCRDERGFTLSELLVALAVLALVLAGLTTIHQGVLQAYVAGSNRTEAQQNARVALERMARAIRETRDPLTLAVETSLTVVDQNTALPVTFSLNAGALIRTTNGVDEVVIGRVQALTFTYRDAADNVLAPPVGTPANVFRVQITLQTASEDPAAGGPTDTRAQLVASVRLRNL
jgi:prepilin-type N-terminal cleavage/methylation domain-containing protein